MKEGRYNLTTEDREEALLFIKGYDLTDEKDFTTYYIEDFIDSIDPNIVPDYDFLYGSTKLVIVPKDRDYVVKIPFNDNEKAVVEYPDGNWTEDYGWDYCEVEQEIYQIAKEHGFEQFFLPIESLTDGFSPYPVYIQKKVEVLDATDKSQERYSSAEAKKKVKLFRKMMSKIDINWRAALLDSLGSMGKMKDFFYFLKKYGIYDDLFNFNLGYCDGKPVILDYGGYRE